MKKKNLIKSSRNFYDEVIQLTRQLDISFIQGHKIHNI